MLLLKLSYGQMVCIRLCHVLMLLAHPVICYSHKQDLSWIGASVHLCPQIQPSSAHAA